jgi:hypothetical protein
MRPAVPASSWVSSLDTGEEAGVDRPAVAGAPMRADLQGVLEELLLIGHELHQVVRLVASNLSLPMWMCTAQDSLAWAPAARIARMICWSGSMSP